MASEIARAITPEPTEEHQIPQAESVKVYGRFRPLSKLEKKLTPNKLKCIIVNGEQLKMQCGLHLEHSCSLDHFYKGKTTQKKIYGQTCRPVLRNLFKGFNGTVFAYGQTGSGKTHSMYGPDLCEMKSKRVGFIPRFVDELFETIEADSMEGHVEEYQVSVSYMELYREQVNDLLQPANTNLPIRQSREKGIFVDRLTNKPARQKKDVYALLATGATNRKVGSHQINDRSSRSHCVFTLMLAQKLKTGEKIEAKVNLVDLAGSEDLRKSGATGLTLKEAQQINLSLSCLGKCIMALIDPKVTHVPFRDSKLTRILQESLNGNTKTTLLVCLSPHHENFAENVSTLRFAERVKLIKTKAVINETVSPKAMHRQLRVLQEQVNSMQRENQQLRKRISILSSGNIGHKVAGPAVPSLPSSVASSPSSAETKVPKGANGVREVASLFGEQIKKRKPKPPPLPASKTKELQKQKLDLECKVDDLRGGIQEAHDELKRFKEGKAELQMQVEMLQKALNTARSESGFKLEQLAHQIAMTKQELELVSLDLEQSHEREQSLRVQLEESKEIATTATTTTNGLKMMLHNKAKIIDLNKTHCDSLLSRAKTASKAKHDALNRCENLEAKLKALQINYLALQSEDATLMKHGEDLQQATESENKPTTTSPTHEQTNAMEAEPQNGSSSASPLSSSPRPRALPRGRGEQSNETKRKFWESRNIVASKRMERVISKGADQLLKEFKQWPNAGPAVNPRTSSKAESHASSLEAGKSAANKRSKHLSRSRAAKASPVISFAGSRSVQLESSGSTSLSGLFPSSRVRKSISPKKNARWFGLKPAVTKRTSSKRQPPGISRSTSRNPFKAGKTKVVSKKRLSRPAVTKRTSSKRQPPGISRSISRNPFKAGKTKMVSKKRFSRSRAAKASPVISFAGSRSVQLESSGSTSLSGVATASTSPPDASPPGAPPSDSAYPGAPPSDSAYPGAPPSDYSPYPGAPPSESPPPGAPSESPPPNSHERSSNQSTTLTSSDPHPGIASPSCPVRKSSLNVDLSVSLEDLRRSFNAKAALFPGAHKHSKSAVFGHSSSSFSGPSMNHSHSKSFRDANGRAFIVDPKSGKTVWTDPVVETSVSPPPPPPPDSPPDTSVSMSNPLSFSNTPPTRSGSLAGDMVLLHDTGANNKNKNPRERRVNERASPLSTARQPRGGSRPSREHNGVVQDYEAVVSASFDQRLQKLKSNHSRNRGSESSSVGAFSRHSHRLSTTESAPQLSVTSVRATSGAFRTRKRNKKRSRKMENEIIELEGAPMIVRGIHSVRHVQAALNNIRANDRVVGSSNVVIVFSTRKRAYFTCAKDKKGKWRVGKKCTFKEETKARFRPVTLQLE